MDKERLAAIQFAREDFYFFVRWMFLQRKKYKWMKAPHHEAICNKLMEVYEGKCSRLVINLPPRGSKTEIAVKMFIAWCMGKAPDSEFIHVCYSGVLAIDNSAEILDMLRSDEYKEIFPAVHLKEDSQSKQDWKTKEGGRMYATGTGGTITGIGAGKRREGFGGAIICDDLHKADEANSDIMRKNVLDWYSNTLQSRVNSPTTPIIIIMQRLHEEDIAGFLLDGRNGEEWEHLCIKAITDEGESFWEEQFPIARLRKMEETQPYMFAGQYQQQPTPDGGGMIQPDKIQIIDQLPNENVQWWRAWDLAATVNGDFTVGAKMGRLKDGRFVIADISRSRVGPDDRDAVILSTAELDGVATKISIPQDPGQAGKTQVVYLTRMLAGYVVKATPESGSKIVRADPFAAQVNAGNVMMLRANWNQALVDELKLFPVAKHDDCVDACSRAFKELLTPQLLNITDEVLAFV